MGEKNDSGRGGVNVINLSLVQQYIYYTYGTYIICFLFVASGRATGLGGVLAQLAPQGPLSVVVEVGIWPWSHCPGHRCRIIIVLCPLEVLEVLVVHP